MLGRHTIFASALPNLKTLPVCSETSINCSHMHYFYASIFLFRWFLYIIHINNLHTIVVFPHSLFILHFLHQKQWIEVSLLWVICLHRKYNMMITF
jgi:hypothetical protein